LAQQTKDMKIELETVINDELKPKKEGISWRND
jgi:hypothetical protein